MELNRKENEICELLDKLTLDALDLIEQDIQCKINIEKITMEGQLLMAKTRYIQGQHSVSESQLPTENTAEFHALLHVVKVNDELNIPTFTAEDHDINKENGYLNPIKWFGVLVPHSIQLAKNKFQNAAKLCIESANIRTKLNVTLSDISKLNYIKNK